MAFLLDTGILLRLINKQEPRHGEVRAAVATLINRAERLYTTTQNFAEYSNVATRPVVNNGLGQSPADALRSFEHEIEPICVILAEKDTIYPELKRLVATYGVTGKQVHDARLVAMMLVWQVENILILNDCDFRRYEPEGIAIVTPAALIGSP